MQNIRWALIRHGGHRFDPDCYRDGPNYLEKVLREIWGFLRLKNSHNLLRMKNENFTLKLNMSHKTISFNSNQFFSYQCSTLTFYSVQNFIKHT
jgi:hypothetical protein